MAEGDTLTFGQADVDVSRMAGFLAGLGVKPGEMVAVFLPSSMDFVRVWLGLGRVGAVAVLLNTELTAASFAISSRACGASLAILDRARLDALKTIADELTHLRRIWSSMPTRR